MLLDDVAALVDVFAKLMDTPDLRARLGDITSNIGRTFYRDTIKARLAVGIDSCLRGCDLVRLELNDVALAGSPRDTVKITPTKTADSSGTEVEFELQPETKAA